MPDRPPQDLAAVRTEDRRLWKELRTMQRQESKSLPDVLQRASLRLASSIAPTPARPPAARHYRRWTEQEEAALRALAPRASLEQIARRLERSPQSVRNKAFLLRVAIGAPRESGWRFRRRSEELPK